MRGQRDRDRERIAELFRASPAGLTRLQVRRALGLGYGVIQRIVAPPVYAVIGVTRGARGYADVWGIKR